MDDVFTHDLKDRKRRFLRGLNYLLGLDYYDLENKDVSIKEIMRINIPEFRERLAEFYCLEFTREELAKLINEGITTGEFTEKYARIVYQDRGKTDLNSLINSSMKNGAVDLREMDNAPKYGLNGSQWCDVAEGPCSCGAWH